MVGRGSVLGGSLVVWGREGVGEAWREERGDRWTEERGDGWREEVEVFREVSMRGVWPRGDWCSKSDGCSRFLNLENEGR